jgi:Caspase domain
MKGGDSHVLLRFSLLVRSRNYVLRIIIVTLLLFWFPSVAGNAAPRVDKSASIAMSELHSDEHGKIVAKDILPSPPPEPATPKATDTLVHPPAKQADTKEKDVWDKAQIISGFLATVVLAGAALLINAGIQRAQIRASADNTNAQIEVAKRNNEAQLALTERNAEVQRQIQQSTLAGQLVEHLTSDSALRKQIAIVALRRSVPPEMYQEIITIVVKTEADPEVRKTALGQAATLSNAEPSVVHAIAEAAKDSTRSGEERKIATDAVQELGLRSITPRGAFVFSSSSGTQPSSESDELKGGIFTYSLLRGLSGAASNNKDGSVRVSELAHYLARSVMELTDGHRQTPAFSSSLAEGDPVILGSGADFTKVVVVAIGNSDYRDSPNLVYAATDAKRFSELFQQHGAIVHLVENATRESFLNAIDSATQEIDDGSLLIFYYSGHAVVGNGTFWLLPVDTHIDRLSLTAISADELKQILFRASARVKILFLDTAFAGRAIDGYL